MLPGGFDEVKEIDEETRVLALNMKEKAEEMLGETFDVFEPILYTTQVVAGTNYNIKVHIGEEVFIHMKIYVPLPVFNKVNELLECEGDKTLFDPLK